VAARSGATWPDIEDWPELDDGYAAHGRVGSYSPNAFGLHEVAGNLWEWCLDGYDSGLYGRSPRQDPVAPWEGAATRLLRGGSFNYAAVYARSAFRRYYTPTDAPHNVGVRPARIVEP